MPTSPPSHVRARLGPWLLAAVLLGGAVVCPVLTASPASAHDVLVNSSPAPGSTLALAPDAIRLGFSDAVLGIGAAVRVTGPAGAAQVGTPQVRGAQLVQALRPGLPAGDYVVRWQVASADGHPVSGRFTFTARAAQPSVRTTATATVSPSAGGSVSPPVSTGPSASTARSVAADRPVAASQDRTGRTVAGLALLAVLVAAAALLVRRRRR